MDLPIFSAALEKLKRKWYEEVELNPETLLMDKKDFSKKKKWGEWDELEMFRDDDTV